MARSQGPTTELPPSNDDDTICEVALRKPLLPYDNPTTKTEPNVQEDLVPCQALSCDHEDATQGMSTYYNELWGTIMPSTLGLKRRTLSVAIRMEIEQERLVKNQQGYEPYHLLELFRLLGHLEVQLPKPMSCGTLFTGIEGRFQPEEKRAIPSNHQNKQRNKYMCCGSGSNSDTSGEIKTVDSFYVESNLIHPFIFSKVHPQGSKHMFDT
ncbi:hypothetical protein RND71_002113 [Anisodus tanguticus]|uniref:Uncharacterized protein n=1 Tax=Anisodus tanguticus TaxID=243964 RepID=A0AAE1T296_9SOLA|nr:hypothetical protein RND71_002113 [Anisodus tanguticus]